jgi:azurin
MLPLQIAASAALLIAAQLSHAEGCRIDIEASDMMQYNVKQLSVSSSCTSIEVHLQHSGKLPAKVMGHDWVLAKSSDLSAIVNAGMAAGSAHGYLPDGDKRIIAATKIVGGGESTTVTFSATALNEGESYSFFCSTPGHATVMRGRFLFGETKQLAQAGK